MKATYGGRGTRTMTWKERAAERRFKETSQLWIRFAEALKADGIKLGQFKGIDQFEAFLWSQYEDARKEVGL